MTDRDPIPQVHVDTRLDRTSSAALRSAFLTVLRRSAALTAVVGALAVGLGYLAAGLPGVYGALVGVGLSALFLLTTVLVMVLTADRSQTVLSAAIAGSWLVKTAIVLVVVLILRDMDFYDPRVLLATVAALVLGTLAVEMGTLARSRVPLDVSRADDGVSPDASGDRSSL